MFRIAYLSMWTSSFVFCQWIIHVFIFIPGRTHSWTCRLHILPYCNFPATLCDDALDAEEIRSGIDTREESKVGVDSDASYSKPLDKGTGAAYTRSSKTSVEKDRDIGVNKLSISDGECFCPECTISRIGPPINSGASLRGAEVFGVDSYAKLFLRTCGHLLVSELAYLRCTMRVHVHDGKYCMKEVIDVMLHFGRINKKIAARVQVANILGSEVKSPGLAIKSPDIEDIVIPIPEVGHVKNAWFIL